MASNTITTVSVSSASVRRGQSIKITSKGTLATVSYITFGNIYYSINSGSTYSVGNMVSGSSWNDVIGYSATIPENTPLGSFTKIRAKLVHNNDATVYKNGPTITILPKAPSVAQISLTRCDSNGHPESRGTYAILGIVLNHDSGGNVIAPTVKIDATVQSAAAWYYNWDATQGLSNVVNFATLTDASKTIFTLINLGDTNTHSVAVTPADTYGSGATTTSKIPAALTGIPIDFKQDGAGVAFGGDSVDDGFVCYAPFIIVASNGKKYMLDVNPSTGAVTGTLIT